MAITRITQSMLNQRSLSSVQGSLTRLSKVQQQMSTGQKINVPSDDPTGTAVALRAQQGVASETQYQRNASDGLNWLSTIDSTLQGVSSQLQRANVLALQGANTASNGATAENALADEVDQITQDVLNASNAAYMGRPVFGGTTAGGAAFAVDSTTTPPTYSYAGDSGQVNRRIGATTVVQVNSDGVAAFGDPSITDPTDPNASIFQHLQALSTALRAGDETGIQAQIGNIQSDMGRVSSALAKEGAAYDEIQTATNVSASNKLALQSTQSSVEDTDLAQATIALQTQTTAYQAALAATAKTMQTSLLDFLS